jgi:hypothetical protein
VSVVNVEHGMWRGQWLGDPLERMSQVGKGVPGLVGVCVRERMVVTLCFWENLDRKCTTLCSLSAAWRRPFVH